jgi:xylulokinase
MSDPASTVLAFDLGTGGCKASVWTDDGSLLGSAVVPYDTSYPDEGRHEQSAALWWESVVQASRHVLSTLPAVVDVDAVAVSGHSLGVVPLDSHGDALVDATPIWSDSRGSAYAERFFETIPEAEWYAGTGCGFPPGLYPIFKLMHLRDTDPWTYARATHIVGCKDFINQRLTGVVSTDVSYASGSGALRTDADTYDAELLAAADVRSELLPTPRPASELVGTVTSSAAEALGLRAGVSVFHGGVDNACMAVGGMSIDVGETYLSLGSSSWVTTTCARPILDLGSRPYSFRALNPSLHVSALSTFSSGISVKWVRTLIGGAAGPLSDEAFIALAGRSRPGANGLLFLPMLAGGSPLEGGPSARGGFVGLSVSHDASDLARACLEGVALAVGRAMHRLRQQVDVAEPILAVGGATLSPWLMQLYADVLGLEVCSSSVDQQAATLGAAASAFVGSAAWDSYADAARAHTIVAQYEPDGTREQVYAPLRRAFADAVTQEHYRITTEERSSHV